MELIGRERELAEVATRIDEGRRLVTLTGPGGIGKTTVATAVLARHGPHFALGAHAVDLSRIDRAEAVGGALAAQLGFSSFDALLQSPGEQPALVLVDNCEHVSDAAATAISDLLAACTAPTVVATSRTPLHLPEESVVALGPLEVPRPGAADASSAAVILFCDRARHVGVTIEGSELEAAAELCRRLDGLPLAIEIAAARTRSLSVAEILERLDEGIDVLSRPRFRGAARHRSLRETVAWSYDLLDDEAQVAFDRLGVCAGPLSLELAAAVALDGPAGPAASLDVLDRLVEASLLVVERRPVGTRYRLLETLRSVALEQLAARGELAATRECFAEHMQATALAMIGASKLRWDADLLADLLDRFDNFDAALRGCLEHDNEPGRALLLYAGLWGVVHQARVDEVLELGTLVRRRWPDIDVPFGPDAAASWAMGQLLCGHRDEAVAIAREALAVAEAPGAGMVVFAPVTLRRVLGLAARGEGDHGVAAAWMGEAAVEAAGLGIATMAMECEVYRAQDLAALGQVDEALAVARRVGREAERADSILNVVWARTVEAAVLTRREPVAALAVAESALGTSEAIGYPFGIMCNLQNVARCHLAVGDVGAAASAAEGLLDAVGRSGTGDLRAALELTADVLEAADVDGANDLLATAVTLPNTNPMATARPTVAAGLGLPPGRTGRVLSPPEAMRHARRGLAAVAPATTRVDGDGAGGVEPIGQAGAASADLGEFVRSGDVWDVRFAGVAVLVKASKGMDDLAALLARPGRDVHCVELAGAAVDEAGTGEVIDAAARRSYEARVRELQADIDEAEDNHDLARAERAQLELDALVDHLTAALGLGGQARHQGGTASRARSAVTHRVRAAIRRIAGVHPALGRHLEVSVTTGTYCSYRPERPVAWRT